jgi:poly-gamma-glutamate synthesis protein (capsule biosynthesis protein)
MRFVLGFLGVLGVALAVTLVLAPDDAGDGGVDDALFVQEPPALLEPTPEPTPAATPTPAPTPTPEPPPIKTLAFSGEVLSHGPVINQAAAYGSRRWPYDYRPMFAEVKPLFESADLAVCHLETPISRDNTALTGYPIFNAPRELAEGLAASGYDTCSTASNHSMDRGPDGVVATVDRLEEAGLGWAGMARSQAEDDAPVLYEVGELTVGHLSYTYGLNGFVLPADEPYLVDVTEVDAVLADAAAYRAAGADLVVLSIQWGNEYQVDPSPEQQELARTFLGSDDIDLIIGAHVHVVQPIEVIDGEYVVYGLGNFLSNQSAECCPAASQNGIIAMVEVTQADSGLWSVTDLSFVPTRVDRTDYTIVPLPQALAGDDLDDGTRALYRQVVAETREVVNRLGAKVRIHR